MKSSSKQVLVVGDRVLIQPHKGDKMSPAGLYLPPSVVEKQDVRDGIVVEVGVVVIAVVNGVIIVAVVDAVVTMVVGVIIVVVVVVVVGVVCN